MTTHNVRHVTRKEIKIEGGKKTPRNCGLNFMTNLAAKPQITWQLVNLDNFQGDVLYRHSGRGLYLPAPAPRSGRSNVISTKPTTASPLATRKTIW